MKKVILLIMTLSLLSGLNTHALSPDADVTELPIGTRIRFEFSPANSLSLSPNSRFTVVCRVEGTRNLWNQPLHGIIFTHNVSVNERLLNSSFEAVLVRDPYLDEGQIPPDDYYKMISGTFHMNEGRNGIFNFKEIDSIWVETQFATQSYFPVSHLIATVEACGGHLILPTPQIISDSKK